MQGIGSIIIERQIRVGQLVVVENVEGAEPVPLFNVSVRRLILTVASGCSIENSAISFCANRCISSLKSSWFMNTRHFGRVGPAQLLPTLECAWNSKNAHCISEIACGYPIVCRKYTGGHWMRQGQVS